MAPNRRMRRMRPEVCLGVAVLLCGLWGCAVQPRGILYTNMRLPLTRNLHDSPAPAEVPNSGRTLEIKEPISGVGLYVQVDSNAIGDIARQNGMQTLYFADRQYFSILGIWTTDKTILYGQ
ncbi:MAG: hypothetical protein HZB87_11875 [Desulfatitalea sp.]|nr:hypothetical protein [Desulfatitalea sp.]MBI5896594.1 hypothetical protein [Desulfobacterales bacterium]